MDKGNPFIAHASNISNAVHGLNSVRDDFVAQQDYGEDSECSEASSEHSPEIDDVVRQDMDQLENIFHDIGFKFRLIDRIGEGILRFNDERGVPYKSIDTFSQAPSLLFIRPRTCTTSTIRMTGTLSSITGHDRHLVEVVRADSLERNLVL